MNLKTITLLTAILVTLTLCGGIYHFVEFVARGHWKDNVSTLITWSISILSEASFALFLFVLFFRQKSKD